MLCLRSLCDVYRDWRRPDAWWQRLQKPHPLGGHWPCGEDRQALDAMFFVLRIGFP
jgi:hypothetical protein